MAYIELKVRSNKDFFSSNFTKIRIISVVKKMSDLSDVIDKTVEVDEEELIKLQDEEFLAEQDKKFEDLRLKLQSLKDENKRQIDTIINSLDQLMAEKNHIDETLKNINSVSDHIDNNLAVDSKHFRVVDYLAKVTGYSDSDDIVLSTEASRDANQKIKTDGSDDCKLKEMEVVDDIKTDETKESTNENCDSNEKSEDSKVDVKDSANEVLNRTEPAKD
ncbi:uncharacterized protein LOC106646211 [Copidosoma floridanum]|uniref:uncharacterized protein LOC106646211 n=1 Tax=Copidosoma floridanum TaxID=29053 RepID=UPI0006C9D903|nr:uncharacterized protein LOC106646211 [Copidosoma floridanum]